MYSICTKSLAELGPCMLCLRLLQINVCLLSVEVRDKLSVNIVYVMLVT